MLEFLSTHKQDIIFAVIVIVAVLFLRKVTNKIHDWLALQKEDKFPGEPQKAIDFLRLILNALWIILGITALSYLFVEESQYETVADDFKRTIYIGVVLALTVIVGTTSNLWFKHDIQKKIFLGEDPTSFQFLRYVVLVIIYFVGILLCLLAIPALKGIAQTALGGAGVLTLIAGLASQEALANIIGGIFIITFKPFRVGDLIKITDTMVGRVKDITLRHTVIRNFENKMIVIPNSIINKEKLINYDMGELKVSERIEIGISYDSDIDLAKKIMQEECENHPLILDNRTQKEKKDGLPIVKTALINLGDSSMTIRAWTWEKDYSDSFQLKIDVLESIKKRFDKEGIEIPFPHRTIVMKKDENDNKY